jgi:ASPIC and UnbV
MDSDQQPIVDWVNFAGGIPTLSLWDTLHDGNLLAIESDLLARTVTMLSSHDPRMALGIGNRTKLDWLEVKWPQPSNLLERFTDLPVDRYITIVEGQGKWR